MTTIHNLETIGELRTCVDIMKCFKQFSLRFGCSVCMKVCPFSQGPGSWERIKKYYDRKHNKKE